MSEHEQREQTDAGGEREETVRDLEVPDDDAGRVSGGQDFNFSKVETYELKKK